jgi:hypothetical protein
MQRPSIAGAEQEGQHHQRDEHAGEFVGGDLPGGDGDTVAIGIHSIGEGVADGRAAEGQYPEGDHVAAAAAVRAVEFEAWRQRGWGHAADDSARLPQKSVL